MTPDDEKIFADLIELLNEGVDDSWWTSHADDDSNFHLLNRLREYAGLSPISEEHLRACQEYNRNHW